MGRITLLVKVLAVLGIWAAAGAGGYSLLFAQTKTLPPAPHNGQPNGKKNDPHHHNNNSGQPVQRPFRNYNAPQQPPANLPGGGVRVNNLPSYQGYLGNTNAPNAFNNWTTPNQLNQLYNNPFFSPFASPLYPYQQNSFNPYLQQNPFYSNTNPWLVAQNPWQQFQNPFQNPFNAFQVQNPFNAFPQAGFNNLMNPFMQFPAGSPFANVAPGAFLGGNAANAPVVGVGFGANAFGADAFGANAFGANPFGAANGFNPALGFRP